jgi:hypothetical protein
MAAREGGGTKVARGLVIAAVIVAAIVLLAVLWRPALDGLDATWQYVWDRVPAQAGQRTALVFYLILAMVLGVLFSKAGHFTAYGIVTGLGALLWFLFWEGFPPLGLSPSWATSIGLDHLAPGLVVLWACVATVLITVVFVPLELREKVSRRRRRND